MKVYTGKNKGRYVLKTVKTGPNKGKKYRVYLKPGQKAPATKKRVTKKAPARKEGSKKTKTRKRKPSVKKAAKKDYATAKLVPLPPHERIGPFPKGEGPQVGAKKGKFHLGYFLKGKGKTAIGGDVFEFKETYIPAFLTDAELKKIHEVQYNKHASEYTESDKKTMDLLRDRVKANRKLFRGMKDPTISVDGSKYKVDVFDYDYTNIE